MPRKSVWPGSSAMIAATPANTTSASHGVLNRGWRRRNRLRQLPVARHRIGDARRADHARVGRDEQDRGGQHPDVDLEHVQRRAVDAHVVDQAQHRVVGEAALLRAQPQGGGVDAVGPLRHRQRGQRDRREREVDREHRDRDEGDRARDVPRRVARLLGEVRDRLDAGVGDHRDRDRQEEVGPGRRDAERDVVNQVWGLKIRTNPRITRSAWVREVDDREHDVEACGLLHARRCSPRPGSPR